MAESFRFVKGTATRTKNRWPIRAKVQALSLVNSGTDAAEAIATVAAEHGIDISETQSYTKNAGSHIGRFRGDVRNAIGNPESKNYQVAVDACEEFGIAIEPVESDSE